MPKIPENIRLIISSVLPLIIVVILFILAGPFGFSKIVDLQNQIDLSKKDKAILSQKLALLQSVSATISQDTNTSLSALPDANPSLAVLSQVKSISAKDGVSLSGIKTSSPINDASGTLHVGITFQIAGGKSQILTFLKDIANIAPLSLIDKIKINQNGDSQLADVTLQSYWAPLPKILPTLTTPISDLTAEERDVITSISSLTQPTFLVVPPAEGSGKVDPFAQ